MKKIYALMVLGAFLVVAGIGSRAYAYPRLAVVPADLDSTVVAENPPGEPATYFSIPDLAERTAELGNQTRAVVDPAASEEVSDDLDREVLVVQMLSCTDLVTVDCSTQQYALASAVSTLAVDPETGEPVAWDGAGIETGGDTEQGIEFEGLTIKFPFDTQQQTYRFWNADLRDTVPVRFVGETTVDGLRAYEFRSSIEPQTISQIDVPGSLVGSDEPSVSVDRVTSSTTTYQVEPRSGVILSATSMPDSWAEHEGERAFTITQGTFVTPDDAAAANVDTYRPLATALQAVRVWVPVGATALGVLLLAAAALLAVRRRRADPGYDGTPDEDESTPLAATGGAR